MACRVPIPTLCPPREHQDGQTVDEIRSDCASDHRRSDDRIVRSHCGYAATGSVFARGGLFRGAGHTVAGPWLGRLPRCRSNADSGQRSSSNRGAWRLEYLRVQRPAESAWPEVLNRALRQASVVNMGTLDYTSFQGYQTLRKYGDALKPAALIASLTLSTVSTFTTAKSTVRRSSPHTTMRCKSPSHTTGCIRIYHGMLRAGMRRLGLIRTDPVMKIDVRDLESRVPLGVCAAEDFEVCCHRLNRIVR